MKRQSKLRSAAMTAFLLAVGLPFSTSAAGENAVGAVYTMTNAPGGNEIVVFARDGKGALTPAGAVATGGTGVGGGIDPLASQGSVVLTQDRRWLLAVNAGSNDISVFRVADGALTLVDVVASGGVMPTSLAVFHELVYVLNAGGTPGVAGFTLNHKGHLSPIAASARALPGVLYSQIGIDPQGDTLVVTDRGNNSLLVFPIGEDGAPSPLPVVTPSHGAGPFSFVFTSPRRMLVAEVGSNAVSSYELQPDGTLNLLVPSVPNGQAATCWIVQADNRFTFTANPGTHSLSSFREQPGRGDLRLLAGVAGAGAAPLDMAASQNGQYLYALDPGSAGIDAFRVLPDGGLAAIGPVPGALPLFAQGLAAY